MSKKKEDNTSAEVSSKQKKKGRLDGMLDAMNERSDPLSTHRVATEYFSSFRSERNIARPQINKQRQPVSNDTTAVDSAVSTAVTTPVNTAVINAGYTQLSEPDILGNSHSNSEASVYSAIQQELINGGTEEIRIGLTRLKELTGLSDKTIRVAIKSLEQKRSIIIRDSSRGIYGRKYFLPNPQDIIQQRIELGIHIDAVSKHILPR